MVWLLATAATAGTWLLVASTAAALASAGPGTPFDELLVELCAVALLIASTRLWLVTTVTVLDLVRGRPGRGGTTRRWIVLACGAALAAGSASPVVAAGGSGTTGGTPPDSDRGVIAGLALPDRAVVGRPPLAEDRHVVRTGDTLWSIAAANPAGASVDARWRAIWRANRAVVGDDPDLILPGQRLALPPTDQDRTAR